MSIQKLILQGNTDELVAACDALTRYSELFGDVAQERVKAFIGSFDRPAEMFTVNFYETSTVGAQNFCFVFKPVDRLLEFLAAMAVDFKVDVEQIVHKVHSTPPRSINLTDIKLCIGNVNDRRCGN